MHQLASQFATGLPLLAGGLTIITTGQGTQRRGLTATAVFSAGLNPPCLLIAIGISSATNAAILKTSSFCVNVLKSDQYDIASRFGGLDGVIGAAKFNDISWTELETGSPVLVDALANFDCVLDDSHVFSKQSLILGRVRAVRTDPEHGPLVYFKKGYCKFQNFIGS